MRTPSHTQHTPTHPHTHTHTQTHTMSSEENIRRNSSEHTFGGALLPGVALLLGMCSLMVTLGLAAYYHHANLWLISMMGSVMPAFYFYVGVQLTAVQLLCSPVHSWCASRMRCLLACLLWIAYCVRVLSIQRAWSWTVAHSSLTMTISIPPSA
jgi:vacuolar-type H+-ATPase subunit I/STV1